MNGSATFRFDGREIPILSGRTIAAALVAAGESRLRHTRQGDRRGVFCGMGVCQECLVEVDGQPAQRACMTAARAGMRVSSQPALARLTIPRATAGTEERVRRCELLVIGGGPGGLSAAAIAGEAGLDVVLVDERAKLGGQYFKQPAAAGSGPPTDAQFIAGRALIDRTAAAGVEVHTGLQVWGAFGLDAICATGSEDRWRFVCDAVIVATGAYERGVPFPGWTLPGVMTTGAAQTLWRSYGVAPGRRILVSGNGPLNLQVAAELTKGGATVVGVAELAAAPSPRQLRALTRMALADPGLIRDGLRYRSTLARARVPVMYSSVVVEVHGDDRARSALVMTVDQAGRRRAGSERQFDLDAVCLGFGFVPSTDIARGLGCRHEASPFGGDLVTVADERGATSREGVWVIGDGAGIRGARHAQVQGELAGMDAVRTLRGSIGAAITRQERAAARAAARHRHFQRGLSEVFLAHRHHEELARPDTSICRCEGVSRDAIERALDGGAGHAGAIKRVTRAGMGPCQGRYCGPVIAAMAGRRTGQAPGELSGFAPTPPIKPIEIGALLDGPRAR
jgi:NADPH-dependent 2,4-dienoyl-CoA reductase/sulfur reductase-like enzyme